MAAGQFLMPLDGSVMNVSMATVAASGGLQNTITNLGASIGTAQAGAVLISALSTSFVTGLADTATVDGQLTADAQVELSAGVPFVSDADLDAALQQAGVPAADATTTADEYSASRLTGLRASLVLLALLSLLALAFTGGIPRRSAAPASPP